MNQVPQLDPIELESHFHILFI